MHQSHISTRPSKLFLCVSTLMCVFLLSTYVFDVQKSPPKGRMKQNGPLARSRGMPICLSVPPLPTRGTENTRAGKWPPQRQLWCKVHIKQSLATPLSFFSCPAFHCKVKPFTCFLSFCTSPCWGWSTIDVFWRQTTTQEKKKQELG